MSKHLIRELVAEQAIIRDAPKVAHEADRSFELPKGFYVGTVALYLGFLAITAVGFASPGLIIPMANLHAVHRCRLRSPGAVDADRAGAQRPEYELGPIVQPGHRHAYGPGDGA